jgi:hypothetical protein
MNVYLSRSNLSNPDLYIGVREPLKANTKFNVHEWTGPDKSALLMSEQNMIFIIPPSCVLPGFAAHCHPNYTLGKGQFTELRDFLDNSVDGNFSNVACLIDSTTFSQGLHRKFKFASLDAYHMIPSCESNWRDNYCTLQLDYDNSFTLFDDGTIQYTKSFYSPCLNTLLETQTNNTTSFKPLFHKALLDRVRK